MLEKDGEGERKGWRQRKFTEFMDYLKEIFGLEGVVLNSYDWSSVGKAKVVDVSASKLLRHPPLGNETDVEKIGGSAGHDAFVLARKFPDLTITVQDLAQVKPVFEKNVPEELKTRVTFMEHDMFNPQPVEADIYLIKLIMHDWPDEEAVKILQALKPALKPGARVIFVEYVGNEEGGSLPRIVKGMGSATDLRIMALFNTEERPASAWKRIFKAADERFDVKNVKSDAAAFYAVLEAVWRG